MKNFIIALVLLALVIGVDLTDMLVVGAASRSLQQTVSALPRYEDAAAAQQTELIQSAQAAYEQFNRRKIGFYLSQHYSEVERLAAEYTSLCAFAVNGDLGHYNASRERILIYLKKLENNGKVSFDNII